MTTRLQHAEAGKAYGFFRSSCKVGNIDRTLKDIRQGMLNDMKLEPEPNIPKELKLNVCGLSLISSGTEATGFVLDIETRLYMKRTASPTAPRDMQLVIIAKEWETKGANFFMQAALPEATNEKAAGELAVVMNILYSGWVVVGRDENDPKPILDIYFRNVEGIYVSKLQLDVQSVKSAR